MVTIAITVRQKSNVERALFDEHKRVMPFLPTVHRSSVVYRRCLSEQPLPSLDSERSLLISPSGLVDLGHQIFADLLCLACLTEEDRQRIEYVCGLPTLILKVAP